MLLRVDESWYRRPANVPEQVSAGGVVARHAHTQLLIALVRERDYPQFVLPKGGVEPGESIEQAARREIEEEAGLTDLELLCPLGQLERLSYNKTHWLTTHFFLFRTEQINGVPTDAANHFGVWWHPIDRLPEMLWPDQAALIQSNRALIETRVMIR